MGFTWNKALASGIVPVAIMVLNRLFGTDFGPDQWMEAAVWAVTQFFVTWATPNKNTIYLNDRAKAIFDRFRRQQDAVERGPNTPAV